MIRSVRPGLAGAHGDVAHHTRRFESGGSARVIGGSAIGRSDAPPFAHVGAGSVRPVEIRHVTTDETEAVTELIVTAYRGLVGGLDEVFVDELLDTELRSREADVLVAVGSGTVIGTLTYVPGPSSAAAEFTDEDAAGVRMLAVAAAARGRGVASLLMARARELAVAAGKRRILLHTTAAMHDAHRLYRRLGYVRDETLDWTPEPDLHLMGYRLEL
jgi:GNAT superfamily N-acetyltransferase